MIKFGSRNLTESELLTIAEYIARAGDFVWDEFDEKEMWSFAETFVLPIPDALKQAGLNITAWEKAN